MNMVISFSEHRGEMMTKKKHNKFSGRVTHDSCRMCVILLLPPTQTLWKGPNQEGVYDELLGHLRGVEKRMMSEEHSCVYIQT